MKSYMISPFQAATYLPNELSNYLSENLHLEQERDNEANYVINYWGARSAIQVFLTHGGNEFCSESNNMGPILEKNSRVILTLFQF